jgi:hypothetical protein
VIDKLLLIRLPQWFIVNSDLTVGLISNNGKIVQSPWSKYPRLRSAENVMYEANLEHNSCSVL